MTQTEECVEQLVVDELIDQKDLIVYNDDVNTFDHVINTLIKILK